MAQNCFHPSIEGAQHGAKNLVQFLDYAKKSGASGAQPSNYMLQSGNGLKTAREIKDTFAKAKKSLDGVSAQCPFWVHTTAWTGRSPIQPLIPAEVAKRSVGEIETWAENGLLRRLELYAELGVEIVPMFWGVAKHPLRFCRYLSVRFPSLAAALAGGFTLATSPCSAASLSGEHTLEAVQRILPSWSGPALASLGITGGIFVAYKLVKTGFHLRIKSRKRELDIHANGDKSGHVP